jgi:DNA-binding response OmpR family regulator
MRLLLCEDDVLIATDLARSLTGLGAEIIAFARNAGDVMDFATASWLKVDAAVLDVSLFGQPVFPAAKILRGRGVAVVFYSGYSSRDLPEDFADAAFINKPAEPSRIMRALVDGVAAR